MSTSSLILTGATKGWDSGLPDATPGDDYDGIITELNPSTGLLTSRSFRVESQRERDDRIYGSCKPLGDENDFYVVGMTTGNLESTDARTDQTAQAFIMKVEVDPTRGYSVKWIRQVRAEGGTGSNNVEGIACAVTPNARNVYMVGRVHGDVVISNTDRGNDMFIMQLDAMEGTTKYMRQIGSFGDDYVMDVTCDKEGNAIRLLTTLGSMYRNNDESKEQDIVVMSVSRADGTFCHDGMVELVSLPRNHLIRYLRWSLLPLHQRWSLTPAAPFCSNHRTDNHTTINRITNPRST